jgi:hypothetical protein
MLSSDGLFIGEERSAGFALLALRALRHLAEAALAVFVLF